MPRITKDNPITNYVSRAELNRIRDSIKRATTPKPKRVDILAILRDVEKRRKLMVDCIVATQAREGIKTTREQAAAAYDKVQKEQR